MKIAVVGNCQTAPMREVFAHFLPEAEVFAIEIWRFNRKDFLNVSKQLDGCDIILSQPILSEHFSPFTMVELTSKAQEQGSELHFFHNLYFGGTLPDCKCIGGLNHRVKGAVSDYHSSIVVTAYLEGCSEKECLARLESGYGMDVVEEWQRSAEQLRQREKHVGTPYADEILAMVREANSFHYFNHPKSNLLLAYGKKILKEVFSVKTEDTWKLPDLLEIHGSWPIYDWVADALNLEYQGGNFITAHKGERLNLPEFIARSYEIYSATPREHMI